MKVNLIFIVLLLICSCYITSIKLRINKKCDWDKVEEQDDDYEFEIDVEEMSKLPESSITAMTEGGSAHDEDEPDIGYSRVPKII